MQMRTTRYIAVLEGEGPGTSRTVLASADPEAVAAVMRVLGERLSRPPVSRAAVLEGQSEAA